MKEENIKRVRLLRMLIKQISLSNFRQYREHQVIKFSCDKEKNVTVILGDNTDIIGESTGIESNAFQEEVKYAQNNYQYFGDEINKEEKVMPYSDVGPSVSIRRRIRLYHIL